MWAWANEGVAALLYSRGSSSGNARPLWLTPTARRCIARRSVTVCAGTRRDVQGDRSQCRFLGTAGLALHAAYIRYPSLFWYSSLTQVFLLLFRYFVPKSKYQGR